MPIADPLRSPIYESGALVQQCNECLWAQRGHRCELVECPQCGQPLKGPLAIEFGGTAVMKLGDNIEIFDNSKNWVVLQRGDLPEIIQFLCKHVDDTRTGTPILEPGRARRIEWRKQFHEHFFSKT